MPPWPDTSSLEEVSEGVLWQDFLTSTKSMDLEDLRNAVRERTEDRSELGRGAREVGENLANLPD